MTITNHGIDYNGGGILRGRRHSPPAKIDSITRRRCRPPPPHHPARGLAEVIFYGFFISTLLFKRGCQS